MKEIFIDAEYLIANPDHIFVFGDNLLRMGKGGAAVLRNYPNVYGFVTQKSIFLGDKNYYTIEEYVPKYIEELLKLIKLIVNNPDKIFLISRIGGGLANRHNIFERIVEPSIRNALKRYINVKFLWTDN